jgi:hypothetical protein
MPKQQTERLLDTRRYMTRAAVQQVIGGGSGQYVLLSDYEDADVLAKIKNVDGAGSGLDADLFAGQPLAATPPTEGQILVYKSGVWTPVIWAPTGEPLVDDSGVTLLDDANDILSEG